MGRSQVKYNQTHGRPGTCAKGRGGRGRGRAPEPSSRRHQPPPPTPGDNAWRYESALVVETSDGMDLEMLELETQRLSQYSTEKLEKSRDGQPLLKGINMSSMGKALDQLSVAQRLGIPAHLTVDLEVRDVNISSSVAPQSEKDKDSAHIQESTGNESDAASKRTGEQGSVADDMKDDNEATGGEVDDLDAWLDSVIT